MKLKPLSKDYHFPKGYKYTEFACFDRLSAYVSLSFGVKEWRCRMVIRRRVKRSGAARDRLKKEQARKRLRLSCINLAGVRSNA